MRFKCWCPDDEDEPEQPRRGLFTSSAHAAEAYASVSYRDEPFLEKNIAVRDQEGVLYRFRVWTEVDVTFYTYELTDGQPGGAA